MRKIKTSRKKTRGKNMKKIFACLLSLSMIPANGAAVFANESKEQQTQTTQVSKQQEAKQSTPVTQAESDTNKAPTFSKESTTIHVGDFTGIKFDNIDEDDIDDVQFDVDEDKVTIRTIDDASGTEYIPEIKSADVKEVTIGATITKRDETKIEVSPVTFKIEKSDSDVVPIRSYGLYQALLNKNGKSVDKNFDNKIEKSELKQVASIEFYNIYDPNITSEELEVVADATECKRIALIEDKKLTNIDFVKGMSKLTEVDLRYTSITTLGTALDQVKDQLKYLNLDGTENKIPFAEKAKFLKDEVEIQAGTAADNLILPGLFDFDDTAEFSTTDDSVIEVEKDYRWSGAGLKISADKDAAGKSAQLTIKDGEDSKTIKINVVGKDQNLPGFEQKTIKDTIGHFSKLNVKDGAYLEDVSVNDEAVAKVEEDYEESSYDGENYFYLEPQNVGTTQIIGTFNKDGVTYTDTIDVTISKAPDNIVPLKSFDAYEGMRDKASESVDVNKDKQIDTTEVLNVEKLYASNSNVTDQDLAGWEYATNCTEINLNDHNQIKDIQWMSKLKKLKSVDLAYTGVTDISALEPIKDQITYLNLKGTNVPAKQRFAWMSDKEITLETGSWMQLPESVRNLIVENSDEVSIADPSLVAYEEDFIPSIDENTANVLKANDKEGETTLTIKNGDEEKQIPIKIKNKAADALGFSQKSITVKQKSFVKVPVKNLGKDDDYTLRVIGNDADTEDTSDILDISRTRNKDGYREMYFVPGSKTGTVTLSGKFEKADGRVYQDTMTVTVVPNDNKDALELTHFDVYDGLVDDQGKSVDTNNDGQIDENEIKNVKQLLLTSTSLSKKEIEILGKAINCTNIELQYSNLTNLDFLENMKNLQQIDLSGDNGIKDFSKLKSFKDQLTYLNLSECKISDEDRFAFIRNTEISVGAGNEVTNPIMPSGIVNETDTYTIEDPNVAEVTDTWTFDEDGYRDQRVVTIKGKAGQQGKETNLVITTENGDVKKIPVKITGNSIVNPPVIPSDPTTPSNPTRPSNPTTPTNPTPPTPQKVNKIAIKGISKNIAAGKKVKLTATVTPANAANKSVTWTTSNKKVATVNASGVVTINKKAGGKSVTITATAKDGSGQKATFKIKVMKGVVKKVTISGKKSVKAGKTLKLKAKVKASKGANKKLTWTSSNTKYATVSSSGKVKALKAGKKKSVKITAMATDGSGKKATVTIKIK